jgi:hypothetical protein
MDQINRLGQKNSTSWRSPQDLACAALAVVLGLVIGWLDLHVTEVVVTILALLVAGLLLGSLRPAAAWRWPILVVVGLPIMAAVAHMIGMQTAEPARLDVRITLVALAFALLGSYVGVLTRHTVRALTSRSR